MSDESVRLNRYLAMCGAEPRWLSVALVIEEGLPMSVLKQVLLELGD